MDPQGSASATAAFPPTYVLYVGSVLLIAGIVRLLSRWTVVHHTVIMFALGAVFGWLSRDYGIVADYVNLDFLTAAQLLQVHTLLLPIIILEYLFGMDPRVFLSCSPMAVFTVCLDYTLTLLLQGAFIFYFLDLYAMPSSPVKTTLIYLLFGSLTSVTDTSYVVNTFYKIGSYWILVKLLEMKRVISLVGACVVYIFVVYVNEYQYQIEWHNVVLFIVLQFLVSPALGWLSAQIMIFWLGRLYNDIGVEITVSIAVAYLLYYFGTVNIAVKPMVSAIAVVVYALLLNNRRTCFSLGLGTFLYKFSSVLGYVVKTVIFTIAGFIITNEDISQHGYNHMMFLPHILVSFTLYSWCMLARGFVAIVLGPLLRRSGYVLSWQELSTMAFCNLTGTVCLITAVASCNIGLVGLFYNNRHIQYMLMFHLGVLAIIRSLVAGTLFQRVLVVLGMQHVSLSRYVAMNNALQKIQEQIKTSARTYKFDRFLADADWDTVYEFTNFDEPYKLMSRYSVVERAMDLDPELFGDLRLNMLHAKRMSFWRQYEQGLLSLRALRILLEECYLAECKVTTSGYDISDQIRKHYQMQANGMFKVVQLLKQKFESIQEVRRQMVDDIWHSAKSKWKRLVFTIGLHIVLEIILIIAILVTTVISIFILVYESHCPVTFLLSEFYYEVNLAFMVFFTVYIILKLYIFKWRYLVLFGSFINISLLIIGWIDIILHEVVLKEPQEVCNELILTHGTVTLNIVVHKLLIACHCLRLIILLEDKTYFFVHAMKKRMLLQLQLGYDVGKAYVYCKEDVFQSAGEFIAQPQTLAEVRRDLQTGRVQLMRELATVQKKYPGIVVSVKSQEACRRLLHVAKETVTQLQSNGRVDSYEADMLDEMIKMRLKRLNQIPAQIELPSVDTLISKLPWVSGDENLIKFLHFNSKLFNMAEGESVDFDSDPTAGLYVLVSGLIRVNWTIGEPYSRLKQTSHIQSDGTIHSTNAMQLHDYLTTGSTFGELALLMETPIAIDAVCETTVLMFHIQYESVRTALDWVTDPSLDWRLWHTAAVRLSIPLLKALPIYKTLSLEDMKVLADQGSLIVQRLDSQFQDDSSEQRFNLARFEKNMHVILIHGTASKSGEMYMGPIIIPPDNNDLVFSSVSCDLYVLYLVPYRTAAAGFSVNVGSLTPSEISTLVEAPVVPRAAAPKKRGRAMSVAANLLAPGPLRFVDEESFDDVQKESLSETDKRTGQEETAEMPEELGLRRTSDLLFSPQLFTPAVPAEASLTYPSMQSVTSVRPAESLKPDESIKSFPYVKSIPHVEPVEAIKEEIAEVSASPVADVEESQQPTQDESVETKTENLTSVPRELSPPVDILSRKSASESEVTRASKSKVTRPYTEAWKVVLPQIQPTLTMSKPAQQSSATRRPTTSVHRPDVASRTVGPAAGQTATDTALTSTGHRVTGASVSEPTTDIDKDNKNVNNPVNNNNNNNNNNSNTNSELHLYPQDSELETPTAATIVSILRQSNSSGQVSRSTVPRLSEKSKNETDSEGTLPCVASGKRSTSCGPVDDASNSTTIMDDNAASELTKLLVVPTTGRLVHKDDEMTDPGLVSNKWTSLASRNRASSIQNHSPAITPDSVGKHKDSNGDSPTFCTSDKSQTSSSDGSGTVEVLNAKVAMESKQAVDEVVNAVLDRRVVNDVVWKSQSTAVRAANVKPDGPDSASTKPGVMECCEGPRLRQPSKTRAMMSDSKKSVLANDRLSQKASQDSQPARNGTESFTVDGRASLKTEKYSQPVTRVEAHLPTSGRPPADVVESRNGDLRRRISAGTRPPTMSASREKNSPTTDGRDSRTPGDSTTSSQVDGFKPQSQHRANST